MQEQVSGSREGAQPEPIGFSMDVAAHQSQNAPRPNGNRKSTRQQKAPTLKHVATGPRTIAGKQRSSRNALKSGIFSKDLVVGSESRAEYASLLNGLREDLQTQGTLETMLAENLAAIIWRKRRLIQAENAEIKKATQFNFLDSVEALRVEAWDRSRSGETSGGILRPSSNPLLIREAVSMLKVFRSRLEAVGFRKDDDPWILRKLYGLDHDDGIPFCLWRIFQVYSELAMEAANGNENPESLDELKKKAIRLFDEEIKTLEWQEKTLVSFNAQKSAYESTAAMIPAQDAMDRFVRYEAHLSREFDRTLNQLERVQRMRRGQPGPPTLNLNIT